MTRFLCQGSPGTRGCLFVRDGFTLIEVMIVVAIIGMLSAMAVPAFLRYRRDAQVTLIAAEMRLFRDGFRAYAIKYADYPRDDEWPGQGGSVDNYIEMQAWTNSKPFGGWYDWDGRAPVGQPTNTGWPYSAFNIRGYTVQDTELQEIDAILDDGNLNTGNLRERVFGGGQKRFVYVLEPD